MFEILFFRLTNWQVSAAVSRKGNTECFIDDFYDEHDLWHMLSAFGLFFVFLVVLTLDDDLATIPSSEIAEF